MPRTQWGRSRWMWLGSLLSIAIGGSIPVAAQVAYTIFPVKTADADIPIPQPTEHGAKAHVTLTVKDGTIESVVTEIARQANLRVLYDNTDSRFAKRLSVRLTNVRVVDAFTTVLQGTELIARITSDSETVVIRAVSSAVPQHSRLAVGTVVGRVTDSASRTGLSGAVVQIEGLKLQALTSDSGKFTLKDVSAGEQVLTVRLFGYKPVEQTITVIDGKQTPVRIVMIPVPTVLSGVVTTATGQQRKVELGNDITALNVDSIMKVAPITSVTDLLETRVPGLTVLHSSGVPGAPSRLRLRGTGSISGNNDPIVIIDGIRVYAAQSNSRNATLAPNFDRNGLANGTNAAGGDASTNGYSAPSPLDQIDPNSIEKVEVFKGPSASALYGSDAANGVIVITTKRGRAGPTHWNLALGQGVNWLPGSWPVNYYLFGKHPAPFGTSPFFLNGNAVVNVDTLSTLCIWDDLTCVKDSLVAFQALNDSRYSVFNRGSDQTASLSISGGVPTLQYSASGSGAGDIGNLKLPSIEQRRYQQFYGKIPGYLVRPDNMTTWGVNGSLTALPSPTVHVTLQSSLFNSHQQQGSLQSAISQLEGTYVNGYKLSSPNLSAPISDTTISLSNVPLIGNDVERNTNAAVTSTNTLNLQWQVKPWLPLTVTGGVNTIQRTDQTYIPFGVSDYGPQGCVGGNNLNYQCNLPDTNGFYGVGHGTSHDQTFQIGTTIPLPRLGMNLAFGGNAYSESTNDLVTSTNQLGPGVSVPVNFLLCHDSAGSLGPVRVCANAASTQQTTNQSTYGVYAQTQIHVLGSMYLNPGFRLDGGNGASSTTSGGLGGLTAFPKIDLSYVAVDQSSPRGPVTLLRPRLAFGFAGTQPDPAAKLRLFSSDTLVFLNGSTTVPGVDLTSLGNTQLRPETSRELEGGVDLELWRGRVSTTLTRYNKTRYNAVITIPIAPSVVGANQNFSYNIGEVRNTGTEITANVIAVQSRQLSWTVGGTVSNDNNVLVKLANGFTPNKTLGIVQGYPLFGAWVKPIVTFADANHDGFIEQNEFRVGDSLGYVGQANPKYTFNFNTALTIGRLMVNATFAYQNGMTQNNQAAIASGAVNSIGNNPGTTLATQAAIVAAEANYTQSNSTNIGFYQTVNTFRFNDLSLNYAIPRSISGRFGVPIASIALQGSNLALHTNYRGIDPNVNAFSTVSGGDATADVGQIPQPRTWWLKLNLGN